jgi:hypothetical protein
LNLPGIEGEREDVQKVLPELAVAYLQLRHAKREENQRTLIEMFLGDLRPTPLDVQCARLEAQAHRAVLTGTQWLTAQEVAELANLGPGHPVATVNRWKQQRRIFAIRRDGRDYFPRYGLGADFRPLPALERVLKILTHYSNERLAAWFESTSGFLGGQRPREALTTDPDRVIAAAQDAVEAEEFTG